MKRRNSDLSEFNEDHKVSLIDPKEVPKSQPLFPTPSPLDGSDEQGKNNLNSNAPVLHFQEQSESFKPG